ncbi:hypothetical protein DPMN_160933 [Dreissena polymorpha]|uniref:Uncharacterized protein n=1 Tax=Dreissena polymorpha TaxID=45954 RepID=A0A9D4IP75_DREPO|nr:hypothetical protein DPMN_160933 [Dreissena polymorpha]
MVEWSDILLFQGSVVRAQLRSTEIQNFKKDIERLADAGASFYIDTKRFLFLNIWYENDDAYAMLHSMHG